MKIGYKYSVNFKPLSAIALFLSFIMTVSCSSDTVRVSGTIHGKPDKMMYIEQIAPSREIIDSVQLNSDGGFSFKHIISSNDPKFLNLQLDGNNLTLLVSKGENVKVNSIFNIPGGYGVEGSEGSRLVMEMGQKVNNVSSQIDSLYQIFNLSTHDIEREQINKEIAQLYIKHKQECIKFLVQNSGSLASIVALYQRMPNGIITFDSEADIIYFSMVADSLFKRYPKSLHVKSLLKDVKSIRGRQKLAGMVNNSLSNSASLSFPEIAMNDMYGEEQLLSALKGKVILLSFWSNADRASTFLNSELKEVYDVYHNRGFEIYQISLDQSKSSWINSITEQKLPWISVNDFKGNTSPAVTGYNITQIPANYLIDRSGNIVGKNIFGADLMKKISEQF